MLGSVVCTNSIKIKIRVMGILYAHTKIQKDTSTGFNHKNTITPTHIYTHTHMRIYT